MPALSEHARSLFSQPIYGWVTATRPDGTPHNTVIWFDVEGDTVVFNTAAGRAKDRYLRENPVASVSVVHPEDPYKWASVSGPVTFSTEDANEVIDRLARKYTGQPFRKLRDGEQRVTVRVKVEHLVEQTQP